MARQHRQRPNAQGSYPALDLWHRLTDQARQRLPRETRIRLWRSACWEQSASIYRGSSPTIEQDDQVRAIGALLQGWTNGDGPATVSKRERITLSPEWQQRYLKAVQAIAETAERAA